MRLFLLCMVCTLQVVKMISLENVDTEWKAYFLGLMYSDGCVSSRNKVSILLKEEDGYLLENIAKWLDKRTRLLERLGRKYLVLSFRDRILHKQLIHNGCLPRKSRENKDDLVFPVINEENIGHFIRGFFDGDGSVYVPSKRANLLYVELVSTSYSFIQDLKDKLLEFGVESHLYRKDDPRENRSFIYRLFVTKQDMVKSFHSLIYKNSSIHLERKRLRFSFYEKPIYQCPHCFSASKKNGKRGNVQRYLCMSCNRGWSTSC